MRLGSATVECLHQIILQNELFEIFCSSNKLNTADGQRFVLTEPVEDAEVQPIRVIINWLDGVRK